MRSTQIKHYYRSKKQFRHDSNKEKCSKQVANIKFQISWGIEVRKIDGPVSFKRQAWLNHVYLKTNTKKATNNEFLKKFIDI